jgi:PhzF family phenazine biosynthesis protein
VALRLKLYQIDAFARSIFEGNPACVCPLDNWIDDDIMQKIANENNLSETAFFVKEDDRYHIRWFTPTKEVDMCGHATLATAYVLFDILNYQKDEIIFNSKSGILKVSKDDKKIKMNFPVQKIKKCNTSDNLLNAFEIKPIECYKSMDYILVFEEEADILNAKPNFELLKKIDARGVIITSKSREYDFINRFFAPTYGIDEDPVTGSAFTQLVPYWSRVLNKTTFKAKQVSQRGGEVFCELKNDRVEISGYAKKYFEGVIEI